jgi:hypothetical protein
MNNQLKSGAHNTSADTKKELVPDELPILPLKNQVAFPMLTQR